MKINFMQQEIKMDPTGLIDVFLFKNISWKICEQRSIITNNDITVNGETILLPAYAHTISLRHNNDVVKQYSFGLSEEMTIEKYEQERKNAIELILKTFIRLADSLSVEYFKATMEFTEES